MTLLREESLLRVFIPNMIIFCLWIGLMKIIRRESSLKNRDLYLLYRQNVIVKGHGNMIKSFINGVTGSEKQNV